MSDIKAYREFLRINGLCPPIVFKRLLRFMHRAVARCNVREIPQIIGIEKLVFKICVDGILVVLQELMAETDFLNNRWLKIYVSAHYAAKALNCLLIVLILHEIFTHYH